MPLDQPIPAAAAAAALGAALEANPDTAPATAPAPAPAPAADFVRPYERKDIKMVHLLVGQGIMEGLARSNTRVYTNPFVLAIWIGLSLVVNHFMGNKPSPDRPLSSLLPFVGFATVALPILGGVEWLNRPSFTRHLRGILGSPDVLSPDQYYSLDPRSTCMVFEHNDEVVGVVAIDGKRAGQDLGTVLGSEEGEIGDNTAVEGGVLESVGIKNPTPGLKKEGTVQGLRQRRKEKSKPVSIPGTVQIRHIGVDAPVRRNGVGAELLAAALDHAFGVASLSDIDATTKPKSGGKVFTPAERAVVMTFPFTPGGDRFFTDLGFSTVAKVESDEWAQPPTVGVMRNKGKWLAIKKDEWVVQREKLFSKKK